jgi:hypothetical protein
MQNKNSLQDIKIIRTLKATGLFNLISKIELYNNVILAYDQDEDTRLKEVVDRIKTPYLKEDLMVAYETDGILTLIWKDEISELFSEGNSVAATFPDDPFPHKYIDYWYIGYSVSARDIEEKHRKDILKKYSFSYN